MYTRTEFDNRRRGAKAVAGRDARLLAIIAVGGGVGQLLMIRWVDRSLSPDVRLWIEGGVFVVYLVVVSWILVRLLRTQRAVAVTCPACGAQLERLSLSVAAATGRCDQCGGRVIG